jgi:N-succinyldiaminopimelate aminotransferase
MLPLTQAAPRPLGRESLRPFGVSIFAEMSALALQHDAINLSQGFPDFDGPPWLADAAAEAVTKGPNQYARSMGLPEFVRAVAEKTKRHYGLDRDPMTEVGVFCGATEGIFSSFMGMLNPGDEVILFEPFYDSYPACAAMAGAIPRYCCLHAPDFAFDRAELEGLFNAKTRMLLLNTPHNPTGKVFRREELEFIADLCRRHDVIVLADEVYEHLTYGPPHIPIATLPGMAERTLTMSSTGKTFSMTGWKIGYAHGPARALAAVHSAHQFATFCAPSPLQRAMAAALAAPDAYFDQLRVDYKERRDFLLGALRAAGMEARAPEGSYFILADISPFGFVDDIAFAKHLVSEIGVACIPPSVFYASRKDEGRRLARFAFCKKMGTLRAAADRLKALKRA